jgi:hypothetical protein
MLVELRSYSVVLECGETDWQFPLFLSRYRYELSKFTSICAVATINAVDPDPHHFGKLIRIRIRNRVIRGS